MIADKSIRGDKKTFTRNKTAKIDAIIKATLKLADTMGYDNMMIRDIAEEANVSVGLIYKYFPGGKAQIVIFGIDTLTVGSLMAPLHSEAIDYGDFPGYMRALIKEYMRAMRENTVLMQALVAASLSRCGIYEKVNTINEKDCAAISGFFSRFEGVDLRGKDPVKLLLNWGLTIKSILIFNLVYLMPVMDEGDLTDLLVDLSLRIWGYREKP